MGNSKVIFGNETLIDLTGDTVTPDNLLAGTTAHNRSGEQIVGTATVPEELDDLTDVTLTSPAEGDLLQYDATAQKWVNSAAVPNALAAVRDNGAYNLMRNDAISATISGITFTVDDDGIITGNGTSTAAIQFDLQGNTYKSLSELGLVANKPYIISGGIQNLAYFRLSSGGSWASIASSDDVGTAFTIPYASYTYRPQLFIPSGTTLNNHKFKPMVYDAALGFSLPYQPYSETNPVLTQKVAGLQATGCVNRLPITGISEVINGVTWTVVKDSNGNVVEVTATGATGANASSFYTGVTSIGSGVYKLTGCPAGGGDNAYYMHPKVNNSWSNDRYEYGDGIIVNGSVENCAITIAPNYTISGTLKFKPMLTPDLSATYADYQPYSMTNRELTEAVSGGYLYEKYDYIAVFGDGAKTVNSLLKEVIDALNAFIGSLTNKGIEITKCEVQSMTNATVQENRIYTASVNTLVFGKSSIEIASGKLETATIRCDTTETNCYATSYKFDTTPSITKSQYGLNVLANGKYVRLYYKQYKQIS